jgi:hypothetical protein
MDELENTSYNPETSADIFLNNTAPLVEQKAPGTLTTLNSAQSLFSGNSYTGPQPGSKGPADPMAYNKAMADAFEMKLASKVDPIAHSRAVSFDASRFGQNFDRYYNHPKFKNLGYSVYRDNESLYNAKSTWLDDFNRMGTQWLGLAGQAFTGSYKGWGKWGDGTDTQDAAKMENALSIAQSSKEGLGAWFTNFAANSAYTVGIMGSVLLEEIALAAIEGGSVGAATPLVASRTAYNTSRLGGALSKLTKSLSNVSEAKSFWQGVKGVASGAGGAAVDFVNPLRNTTGILGDMASGEKTVSRLNEFAKVKKTFGSFYRDMRELNLVLSEARLEGGFAKNKVVSDGTSAFIKEKGRMPNEAENKEIYENAQQAGVKTAMLNMPAIYLSNRIVFDTMFKGFKPLGKLINPGPGKNPFFKVVRNYDWKKGVAGGPYSMGKAGFNFSDLSLKSLKGTFSRLSKEGLPALSGKAFRYTSANLAEGLQESFQETVQSGYTDYYLNDYYAKLYKDPFLAAKNSMNAAFDKAVKSQFTKQGLDVFLSGFLMGGGIQPIQNLVMNKGQLLSMKLGKKEKFDQYKTDQEKWTKKQVDALNSVAQDPIQYAKWLDQNLMLQRDLSKEYDEAVEEGDEKTANDAQQDSLFHHVHTLLQSGRYDAFTDSLQDLRNLDGNDLADAFEGVEIGRNKKKSLHERLNKVIDKADNIKERFDLINEEYPNPFNPNLIDPKKSPDQYMDELRAHDSFEESKKHAMFSEYSFGQALKRMDSIVNKASANNPIGATAAPDVSLIFSPVQTRAAIATLKIEISALSQGAPDQKKQSKSKEITLGHLNNLSNLRTDYSRALYLIKKASQNNTDALTSLQELFESLDTKSIKIYDEDGKKINFKDAKVPLDVKIEAFYRENLRDVYIAYMKNIAKTKNVYPLLEDLNKSFVDYLDYLALDSDARSRAEDIDALTNPRILLEYSQRIMAARKLADDQREVLQAEALEKYRQFATNNKMLQDLLAIGVYFDPELFDEFRDNDIIPERFIDVRTGHQVTAEDPRYKEIIEVIDNYEQATGKTFSGKPVAPKTETPPIPPVGTVVPPPDGKKTTATPPPATSMGKVDVSTLPQDVQDQLKTAFEEAKKAGATDFELWIEESVIAQSIIQGKKPKAPTPQRRRPVKNEITVNNPKSTSGPDAVTAPIYAEPSVLNADETAYVSHDKESGKTVESKRVTSLKKNKIPSEILNSAKVIRSSERGNVLDDITRYFSKPVDKPFETNPDFKTLSLKDDVLNAIYRGVGGLERQALRDNIDAIASQLANKTHKDKKGPDGKPLKYSITMTDGFKDSLVEVLRTMAIELEEYTWNTNLPALHGILLDERYAGSVDLLLEQKGEYSIVDLKSSEQSRRAQPDIYNEDPIQLNAYADLFEQMTGKPIKNLYIINMIVTSSDDGKVLDNIILDTFTDPVTREDTILIPIDRTPIDQLLGEAKPEGIEVNPPPVPPTPPAPAVPPTPPAPAAPVSDKKADIERRRQEVRNGIKKAGQGEGGQFTVTLLDGTKENAVRLSLVGNELFVGNKDVIVDLSVIKKVENPDGTVLYDAELAATQSSTSVEDAKADAQKVETYRAQEIAEFRRDVENAESFIVNGRIDSKKVKASSNAKAKEIYDRYDKLITPLLPAAPAPEVKPTSTKKSVPNQYAGKIIYAIPGSVIPAAFDSYDLVNGDDILKDILVAKGLMSPSVNSSESGLVLYKALMDDKKITPAEQKAITEEAGAKMRELADSGKTVVTSNEFMADPSKVDIISLPSANEVFYLEKDPVKSVDRFKKKIATKDYIKALYNNPDIADKVTRASLQDMIMGEIKDNPIIQSIVKATDPQLVMTKIKAFFSMDEEARMSLFYNVNEEGEQIPYSEQEMVDLAKRVITKIEKNKEEREVLLSELDELLPTMTPETSITPEEKESVNTVVESGKDFDESQGTLRNLYDEAKTKTPEELREELLKKAGCKPDSNKAPF